MGLLLPPTGSGTFHLMFLSGPQVVGADLSGLIPSRSGPRNAGQSAARAAAATDARKTRTSNVNDRDMAGSSARGTSRRRFAARVRRGGFNARALPTVMSYVTGRRNTGARRETSAQLPRPRKNSRLKP